MASDWSRGVTWLVEMTSSNMADGGHVVWSGKPRTGWKKGSRAQGTGSHVVWVGKPLTGREKEARAQATGSHVVWGATPRIGWAKGARAQSPKSKSSTGGGTYWKGMRPKKMPCWKIHNFFNSFFFTRVQSPNG